MAARTLPKPAARGKAVARPVHHAITAAHSPSEALAQEGQDRWPSGLRHTLGKRAWCNSHRGFESRPVRQENAKEPIKLALSCLSSFGPRLDPHEHESVTGNAVFKDVVAVQNVRRLARAVRLGHADAVGEQDLDLGALALDGLPFYFAGIWDGDRGTKAKPNVGRHRLYAFLPREPNGIVEPIHSKAMPVLLTTPDDVERWLLPDWSIARAE
jgi:hypothetical protein